METTTSNALTTVHDQILDALGTARDVAVGATEQWASTLKPFVPEQAAERLPDPVDLVNAAFDLAIDVMAAPRRFTEGRVGGREPVAASAPSPA